MNDKKIYSLGIIGVRGYVGKELLALISNHPQIQTQWLSSRQLAGQRAKSVFDDTDLTRGDLDFDIESLSPEEAAAKDTDIIVLALPNGLAEPFVQALEASGNCRLILDLSADYRFPEPDDDKNWIYSVPELDHQDLEKARSSKLIKISNPGCYATAMLLGLSPIMQLLSNRPHCFGVSGFSGAGTTPSPNNDPDNLKDNLIGYKLLEHLHEKEVSLRLQNPVSFTPHVAAFFRGINMTIQVEFNQPQTSDELLKQYQDFYSNSSLVNCQSDIPVVKQVIHTAGCVIGGFAVSEDGKRATIVSCLDNLMKGAASQALQNINIALGIDPLLSVEKSNVEKNSIDTNEGKQ